MPAVWGHPLRCAQEVSFGGTAGSCGPCSAGRLRGREYPAGGKHVGGAQRVCSLVLAVLPGDRLRWSCESSEGIPEVRRGWRPYLVPGSPAPAVARGGAGVAAAAPAPPSCCDCRSPAPGKERDGHWWSRLPALTCRVDVGTREWPQGLGRQGPVPSRGTAREMGGLAVKGPLPMTQVLLTCKAWRAAPRRCRARAWSPARAATRASRRAPTRRVRP